MTNSERRVQRVRKALDPPGEARDDIVDHRASSRRRLGHDWRDADAEEVWDELRSLSPMHAGMSYERLEELGGIQWPCPDEDAPGLAVPARAAVGASPLDGPPAPFSRRRARRPPVEELDDEFPIRLTTGRRLDSYNTGVQTGGYRSPLRRGETLDLSPEDAERLGRRRRRGRARRRRAAARSRRRSASTRRCARASRS